MPRKKSDPESSKAKPRTAKKSVAEPKAPKPRAKRAIKPQAPTSETITLASNPPMTEEVIRDRIAKRAYELYLNQGGQHGQDAHHWAQAEKEIKEQRNQKQE